MTNIIYIFNYIKKIIVKIVQSQRVVPFVSGTISIKLLNDVIYSELNLLQYYVAIGSYLSVFIFSLLTYTYLSKIEKDKDTAMLEMTKRIIEAVYKHFGVAMANKDAAATANVMNPIMQTIVTLVKEFQKLAEKGYKE